LQSPLLSVFVRLYHAFGSFSPLYWVERRRGPLPYRYAESWVVLNLGIQFGVLAFVNPGATFAIIVALYGLVGVTAAFLRDAIISPTLHRDTHGRYIRIRNRPRWLLLALLGVLQVPTCFAVLFLARGYDFCPPITDPLTAFYQSLLTFTTLGYGEIHPVSSAGRLVVAVELLFFLIFVGVRLPLAVSVMRVKEEE